ncbi:MAG: hypothetical protein WDA75_19715 [Candidatus Latescibacterota bacterium]|jgi:hypothetical protein
MIAVVRTNPSDLLEIHADGTATLNLGQATPEQLCAIKRYRAKVQMVGDGPPVIALDVAFMDRLKAWVEVGKAMGYYAPAKVAQTNAAGRDVDPEAAREKLNRRLTAVLDRLTSKPAPARVSGS